MNVLVTGASGYIGSNFIDLYKKKYTFETFSLLNKKFEDIYFDNIDAILHCAALVHQKIQLSYDEYRKMNVEYPVTLAKLAKESGVKQFVYLSSIAVYGDALDTIDEKTTCSPVTFYGKSKLEAEEQLLALGDENFSVSIIRPPMVYGKGAPGNIKSLINLIKKVPFIPLGGILNKRSFVFIDNLCYLIDQVIEQKKADIFLASDDQSLSTTELIELIAKNLHKKIYLFQLPMFETLLRVLKPTFHKRLYKSLEIDNTATKKALHLTSLYTAQEGIKLMLQRERK